MSHQRYTAEFKDEAVRQVTEKGHSVQEVAARLGVSSDAGPRSLKEPWSVWFVFIMTWLVFSA
jgi:transposase